MKYSINWLKSQLEKGLAFEYLFFWGHTAKTEGIIDKSCFSQWFPSPFVIDGISYATAEHWMMAQKARLFKDEESFQKIITAPKPADAKALGRAVSNFDPATWEASSFSIVVEGNKHKFLQNEELKKFLLSTADKVIVEASPPDKIWGIGLPQDAPGAQDPFTWQGTNLLGFALMEVRDILKRK